MARWAATSSSDVVPDSYIWTALVRRPAGCALPHPRSVTHLSSLRSFRHGGEAPRFVAAETIEIEELLWAAAGAFVPPSIPARDDVGDPPRGRRLLGSSRLSGIAPHQWIRGCRCESAGARSPTTASKRSPWWARKGRTARWFPAASPCVTTADTFVLVTPLPASPRRTPSAPETINRSALDTSVWGGWGGAGVIPDEWIPGTGARPTDVPFRQAPESHSADSVADRLRVA